DAALGLEVIEQEADALEVLDRLEILQQMRGAAHDQLALVAFAARPAAEPGRDDLLGERIELRLLGYDRLFKLDLGFRKRAAAHMGVEEIRGFEIGRAHVS